MKPMLLLVPALAALLFAAPVRADTSLTAYDAARAALLAIWAELPLTVRNVTLTAGTARGYGDYTVHDGNSFTAGEKINVYVEVLGYGFKDNGDGTQSKLLDADLKLIDASGTTVATEDKFFTSDVRSREKPLETYLAFNATLTKFDPGYYKLQFVLHDRAGNKDATFEVPVTLTGDASSSQAPASSSSAAQ